MEQYDALVIGGGPAGLGGALYLARFRRSVLLIDDGDSRAVRIPRSHNYPGFENGVNGAALVAVMRQQAAKYGVRFVDGRGGGLYRQADRDGGFGLYWERAGTKVGEAQGRSILLATGASDIEPTMPHLGAAVRDGTLRYCPVCDAYECIGKSIGVITDSSKGLQEAFYLCHFADQVTVFLTTAEVDIPADKLYELKAAGIGFVPQAVADIRHAEGKIILRHGDDASVCDSMYCALGMRVHSGLATALGAASDDSGYLLTDRHHCTTVEGLYCAGDVAQGLNQISVATGGAAIAAAAMHLRMGGAHMRMRKPADAPKSG